MAVVSRVTVVPNARIAGVALTGLHGYKALAAMGKTLEHHGGERVLRKHEGGRTHKSKAPLFHTVFPCLKRHIVQQSISESMDLRGSDSASAGDSLLRHEKDKRQFRNSAEMVGSCELAWYGCLRRMPDIGRTPSKPFARPLCGASAKERLLEWVMKMLPCPLAASHALQGWNDIPDLIPSCF